MDPRPPASSGGSAGNGGSGGSGGSGGNGGSAGAAGAGGRGGTGGGAGSSGASGTGGGAMPPYKGVANSPCAARKMLGVTWYYNWTQTESEPCSNGQGGQFVPMIWGHTGNEQSATGIASSITSFVNKGYGFVLGFNEPDNTDAVEHPGRDGDLAVAVVQQRGDQDRHAGHRRRTRTRAWPGTPAT